MPPAKKKKNQESEEDLFSPEVQKALAEKATKQFEAELAAAHEQEERRRKIPK
jgi:hypothetical protein